MRENRPSGSEGGVALIPPSLPLSNASRVRGRRARSRQCKQSGGSLLLRDTGRGGTRSSMESLPSGRGGTRLPIPEADWVWAGSQGLHAIFKGSFCRPAWSR